MRVPRVVSIVPAVLLVAGSFLAGAGSASAGEVARGPGAAVPADASSGIDRGVHRQRDARFRRARSGLRRRGRRRDHGGWRARGDQDGRGREGHAGHAVRDRLGIQELHGAGRDATGRGGQGRPGRRDWAVSRRLRGPARGRHHDPAAAQPHEWLLHDAGERVAYVRHRWQGRAGEPGRPDRRDRSGQPTRSGVGVLEHELSDSWPPDRSRQRAGVPGLRDGQHPRAGRHGAQLRRRR